MTSLLGLLIAILALCGAPLFIVIAGAALLSFQVLEVDLSIVIIEMYRLASNPVLGALVLFAFAGYMLAEGGASRRLVRLSAALFGRLPGGLAIVSLFVCAFFTALTGASGITIVALGGILFPALIADQYSEKFTLGLLTSSGSLGVLFPPSLPLIIYGLVTETDVQKLFLAGLVPGALMMVLLSGYGIFQGRSAARHASFHWNELIAATRAAFWEILLPVVVLGGIFSGLLVLSEAAAITAFYVFFVEIFIHRDLRAQDLPGIIVKTAVMTGGIIVILGASLGFNSFLIDQQVPNRILALIQTYVSSKAAFLVLLNLFLLVVGCLLDIFSALVIVVPLIVPLAQSYGIDLIHLGIIFLANLQIGYSTPPIGMNLFIASLRFEKPITRLTWASLPFLAILLVALGLIMFIPALSLWPVL
jgi:tripartite ATP-independent transporter DctM subunit